jgi:hypothetical protein
MTDSALGLFTEGLLFHESELWSTRTRERDMIIDDPILRMHKQLPLFSRYVKDERDTDLDDHLAAFQILTHSLKLIQELSDVICRKPDRSMELQEWWLVGIFLGHLAAEPTSDSPFPS